MAQHAAPRANDLKFDIVVGQIEDKISKIVEQAIRGAKRAANAAKPAHIRRLEKKYKRDFHVQPFTLEVILRAYDDTGLVPSQGIYYVNSQGRVIKRGYVDDDREIACPLGALCLVLRTKFRGTSADNWKDTEVAGALHIPSQFVSGFTYGFDGGSQPHPNCSAWYHQGFMNGRDILQQMIKAERISLTTAVQDEPLIEEDRESAKRSSKEDLEEQLAIDFAEERSDAKYQDSDVVTDDDLKFLGSSLSRVYEVEIPETDDDPPEITDSFLAHARFLLHSITSKSPIYMTSGRFGEDRYSAEGMLQELENNTQVAQSWVKELLFVASNILQHEAKRHPVPKPDYSEPAIGSYQENISEPAPNSPAEPPP